MTQLEKVIEAERIQSKEKPSIAMNPSCFGSQCSLCIDGSAKGVFNIEEQINYINSGNVVQRCRAPNENRWRDKNPHIAKNKKCVNAKLTRQRQQQQSCLCNASSQKCKKCFKEEEALHLLILLIADSSLNHSEPYCCIYDPQCYSYLHRSSLLHTLHHDTSWFVIGFLRITTRSGLTLNSSRWASDLSFNFVVVHNWKSISTAGAEVH